METVQVGDGNVEGEVVRSGWVWWCVSAVLGGEGPVVV